jgi:hypothetical protein
VFRGFVPFRVFVLRRTLLVFALSFVIISAGIAASGGFTTSLGGVRLSAHSPVPTAAAAALTCGLWLLAAKRSRAITADLIAAAAWLDRHASGMVLVIAGLAAAVAVRFSTFSASGSDPSGYLSQAAMLTTGALSHIEPLAAIAEWPDALSTLAPLGWRATGDAMQVPTYAVGLPLLMAIPHAFGGPLAASLVVSGSAFAMVWFGARIATTMAGGAAGFIAAAWIATMPIAIYESIQPMSDVPVTAAWLACWYWIAVSAEKATVPISAEVATLAVETTSVSKAAALLAGIAAAVAVLIRPNLAPLVVIPWLYLAVARRGVPVHVRVKDALMFAVPVAMAGIAVAYLQWRWFGSPLRSGYGSASEIYALSNLAPNLVLYLGWLLETHGPWLLVGPLALFVTGAPLLRWMLLFGLLVCLAYFLYAQFEAWPYLRFLLPSMTIAAIAASTLLHTAIRKGPPACAFAAIVAVVLLVAGPQVASARELSVFRLAARQARALLAGHYLAAALPPNAVLVAGEQSGAMRYYTGRSIVRWDFIAPETLPNVAQRLGANGKDVWFILDDWEVGKFREKFQRGAAGAGPSGASLDWPPVMDAGVEGRTYGWRLRDRQRFLRGEVIHGERVR